MIIYLHGFRSSPASAKSRMLKQHMQMCGLEHALWNAQLPNKPAEAIALLDRVIASAPTRPTLVGSSLGGFYATVLAERHALQAVLVNPVVISRQSPEKWIGTHTMIYTGETFELTAEDTLTLQSLHPQNLHTPSNYWLLAEQGDEVLDYRHAAAYYAGARQTILPGGNHSFSRWADYLVEIITFSGLTPQHASS